MLIPGENLINLIDSIYSNLTQNSKNMNYLVSRAILTPKNEDVEKISNIVIDRLPNDTYIYTSVNFIDLTERQP